MLKKTTVLPWEVIVVLEVLYQLEQAVFITHALLRPQETQRRHIFLMQKFRVQN